MRLRKFFNTLLGHVTIPLTMILLAGSLLIALINVKMFRELKQDTLDFAELSLESSTNVMSAQLDVMSAFYRNLFINDVNYQQVKKPVSEQAYYMAATQILQNMDDVFFSYSGIACTYCYVADRDYLIQSSTHPNYEQSELIKEYIKEKHRQTDALQYAQSTWHMAQIGDNWYLLNTIRQNSVEIGIVLSGDDLLRNMHLLDNRQDSALYITDTDGRFMTGIAVRNSEVIPCTEEVMETSGMIEVTSGSQQLPYTFHLSFPEQVILAPLIRQTAMNIAVMLAVLAATFFLVLYLFYRYTAKPVSDMANVAQGLGSGQLDQRLPETGRITELTEINRNFNQLITQISALKIDLYEEKLHRQEAELARLRLQLNPHFLLNSLNLVYTMVRQQHHDVAMQFTMCLIRHFRFVLKKNHNFVPLPEELDFCENYMRILSLQYPEYFCYEISASDQAAEQETLVPPLSIENLVENAVKYGLTQEKPLHVRIHIEGLQQDRLRFTRIEIRDDGPGYSDEALEYIHRIQDGDDLKNIASDGVGLKNLIERLRILYEGRAELSFGNDHGARIVMTIPTVWPQSIVDAGMKKS